MFECPVCQSTMEEEARLLTVCCDAVVDADDEVCPVCGMEEPELVEGELHLVCANCGYTEE